MLAEILGAKWFSYYIDNQPRFMLSFKDLRRPPRWYEVVAPDEGCETSIEESVPNYPADLNACYAVEETLNPRLLSWPPGSDTGCMKWRDYRRVLMEIAQGQKMPAEHATARQRTLALILTLQTPTQAPLNYENA